MTAIVLVVTLCLLVHECTGCSFWNQGKPCRCACEDASKDCRKDCYNMCYLKICRSTEILDQTRCYNQCGQTFSTCFNGCK